jgi:hypothetical protein
MSGGCSVVSLSRKECLITGMEMKKPKTSKGQNLCWSNLQWTPMDLFYMYKNAGACPNQLNWPDNMKAFHCLKKLELKSQNKE